MKRKASAIKISPAFALSLLAMSPVMSPSPLHAADPLFELELVTAGRGFDRKTCWVHPRAGVIPPGAEGNPDDQPLAVMTLQRLLLSGSDVFEGLNSMRSSDLGKSWTEPLAHPSFQRRPFSWQGREGLEITVSDFWPKWHAGSGKLLGIGHTVIYDEKNQVLEDRPRRTAYAAYDPAAQSWSPWQTLEMPDDPKFGSCGAGCVQRCDLPDGGILLPVSFQALGTPAKSVAVLRCTFDGGRLRYVRHGNELSLPVDRGLGEPSLVSWGGRYFLTLRNDRHGYVSRSEDGLDYSAPKRWTFDDGSDLGNYNTQQHWVAHPDALFLVYTRRGAGNDHVFRHRAPLFIARVDPDKLHVIRTSEQVLVPDFGARLGNFGVTEVSRHETWVTVAEWMQGPAPRPRDPEPLIARGADNRIWVARLKWKTPNQAVGW